MSYPVILPNIGNKLAEDIDDEIARARKWGEKFASLHEAWAVAWEELDEIWEITRQKRNERDPEKLRKEFVQLAAMAIKAIHSMENFHMAPLCSECGVTMKPEGSGFKCPNCGSTSGSS